ncbi:hypothetical protein Pla22_17350 [Rubripirellula amarantea]|uniref:Uncharacterized protein n=1 Tax=Rubripirellula amarantea TaxID=2527999 RepID=A0A5C5WU83_9BACT|nr:hypothetical protein [Rubripirellula amarantea]TWT54100.1 hypothetical protein Pla22_17350 [Rubripirellula amarantea]
MKKYCLIAFMFVAFHYAPSPAFAQFSLSIGGFSIGNVPRGYYHPPHVGYDRYGAYVDPYGPHYGIPVYPRYSYPQYSNRGFALGVPLQRYDYPDYDYRDYGRYDRDLYLAPYAYRDRDYDLDRGRYSGPSYVYPQDDSFGQSWQSPDLTDNAIVSDLGEQTFGETRLRRSLDTDQLHFAWSDERLARDAEMLKQGLAARADDADVWLGYLNPDLVIENAENDQAVSVMKELLRNYEGLSGNATLSSIWIVPGFRETHQGLSAWVSRRVGEEMEGEAVESLPEPVPVPLDPVQDDTVSEGAGLAEPDSDESDILDGEYSVPL